MRTRRGISRLLTVMGIVFAFGTIGIVIQAVSASPVMLKPPEMAASRADALMDAVCSGDWEAASEFLYGCPSLGTRPEDSSPAVDLLWDAFLESLEYSFLGDCYVSDSGVSIDVRVQSLDVSAVVDDLDSRAQTLLNENVFLAEDSTEIYDEENNFRQELVSEVLQQAVQQALEENRQLWEQTVSLYLIFEQGKWWVMPDDGLVNVLSGSFFG